ncbi:MAG: hypothetical protein PHO74_02475 [Weeksellaceae bacterium]|jgi:hypothetical protein|nr:hypothetical protein [Weeksellaceae bacterium]
MKTPEFLLADNSAYPEKIFILHTEFPRFLMDIETEEIEWFDVPEEEEGIDIEAEIAELITKAYHFFDAEMEAYE